MEEETTGMVMPALTEEGATLTAGTYGATPQVATWKRRKHIADAGATNFFDILITSEVRLQGGDYMIDNFSDVHEDDYIEFSIVDKDNTLGLFATYGLTEGVDILELFKLVRNEYPDEVGAKFFTAQGCAYKVIPGLYFRAAYSSFGAVDIKFKTRILWFE